MLKKIIKAKWERRKFPQDLCVVPSPREPEVLSPPPTEGWFLCMLENQEWPNQVEFRVLHPYTCPDVDKPSYTLFGWADQDGNFWDHKTRAIHLDDTRVVAWAPWTGKVPK